MGNYYKYHFIRAKFKKWKKKLYSNFYSNIFQGHFVEMEGGRGGERGRAERRERERDSSKRMKHFISTLSFNKNKFQLSS